MITKEQVAAIVEANLQGTAKFLVEVVVQPGNRLVVYIDGDSGVTIDDCNELSRFIEQQLDREREDFDLTVSSSGLDRPLKLLRQYRKNLGRELVVTPVEGEPVTGTLVRADESGIELEHPVKNTKKEIRKENTVFGFNELKTVKIIIKIGK